MLDLDEPQCNDKQRDDSPLGRWYLPDDEWYAFMRRLRLLAQSVIGREGPDRQDNKKDSGKKNQNRVPENPKVARALNAILDPRNSGRQKTEMVRELIGGDGREIANILRQVNRFLDPSLKSPKRKNASQKRDTPFE